MSARLTRREWISMAGTTAIALPLVHALPAQVRIAPPEPPAALSSEDERLLDRIQHAAFDFFWEQASPRTGQVKDRALATGSNDRHTLSSIAATGFGLAALCIADTRAYKSRAELLQRARLTLRFLLGILHEHGFFFHFIDVGTGAPAPNSEVSSIDTAILMCGILTCRAHFADPQLSEMATRLYQRVDWVWMLNGGETLSMGWKPEGGFLKSRWDTYSELMMLYLLGIGSPTHPLPPSSWNAFARPWLEYQGLRYITTRAPLFIHQYSHAFFDFRNRRDQYTDYFENSRIATQAHKKFCLSLHDRFPDYSENLWGITASDSAHGYVAWGGPPEMGPIDGSIVPSAAGGSLPFAPAACIQVLRSIEQRYGEKVWKRYGFSDAFNPLNGWVDADVLGINLGITMLMAENLRSGLVWKTFMTNPEAQQAMEKVGLKKY